MGAPHHKPTDEIRMRVAALKSYGITDDLIARVLDMSTDTLNKYYQKEIDTSLAIATEKIAGKLFKKAYYDEDMTAIIFWLKTRARWKTADKEAVVESTDELARELKELRIKLDEKNKKEY